CARDHSGYDNW
nr:immunoglobulin heavy chain junction region [Macaca mulatta]MOW76315.1 immunoglobulin heavy chain junction region [Macaca mulatta]MOW76896.1 immunoglobulin heavy chain junction region [Macaca mulatta]MOW76927.1 immunoglobulin heavy chain junction region [Macaca mulatta]MOW77600.1 immunoglobulin heavy chain junction region [Macaca mulatta]